MATQKISLYDAVRNILVEVDVSAVDAQRAATDTVFATELMNQFSNKNEQDENLIYSVDDIIDEETLNPEDTGDLRAETQESEVSLYRWSPPCVLLLLDTYRSMEQEFNSGKLSQKKVWEKISEVLKQQGYDVTGAQCSSKLRSLKKSYKSIKDHHSKSGNDRRTWQFFNIMEEIFAKKAWCEPVSIASSTGLSQSKNDDSMDGSDSDCSIQPSKTKIETLLGKRLKQKEEHEEQKRKRHKERMEMDEKFLKVLEKLANK